MIIIRLHISMHVYIFMDSIEEVEIKKRFVLLKILTMMYSFILKICKKCIKICGLIIVMC